MTAKTLTCERAQSQHSQLQKSHISMQAAVVDYPCSPPGQIPWRGLEVAASGNKARWPLADSGCWPPASLWVGKAAPTISLLLPHPLLPTIKSTGPFSPLLPHLTQCCSNPPYPSEVQNTTKKYTIWLHECYTNWASTQTRCHLHGKDETKQ